MLGAPLASSGLPTGLQAGKNIGNQVAKQLASNPDPSLCSPNDRQGDDL